MVLPGASGLHGRKFFGASYLLHAAGAGDSEREPFHLHVQVLRTLCVCEESHDTRHHAGQRVPHPTEHPSRCECSAFRVRVPAVINIFCCSFALITSVGDVMAGRKIARQQ